MPETILVSPETFSLPSGPKLMDQLRQLPRSVVSVATADCVARACDTVTPQGSVAVMKRPLWSLPAQLNFVLVLDTVSDPGNMGTLIRTAAGLGVDAVIMSGDCVDPWSPKSIRSSMGSIFRVPSISLPNWQDTKELLTQRGDIKMYAADASGKETYYDADWHSQAVALIVGSEAGGLCKDARDDMKAGVITGLSVPMANGVESLNAAIAGAIILGEAARQRHIAGVGSVAKEKKK